MCLPTWKIPSSAQSRTWLSIRCSRTHRHVSKIQTCTVATVRIFFAEPRRLEHGGHHVASQCLQCIFAFNAFSASNTESIKALKGFVLPIHPGKREERKTIAPPCWRNPRAIHRPCACSSIPVYATNDKPAYPVAATAGLKSLNNTG